MIPTPKFQGDNWLQLSWDLQSKMYRLGHENQAGSRIRVVDLKPQPYTNPPTMHQASIFDNFHVFIACIQIIFNYKLASMISINRANLFVL